MKLVALIGFLLAPLMEMFMPVQNFSYLETPTAIWRAHPNLILEPYSPILGSATLDKMYRFSGPPGDLASDLQNTLDKKELLLSSGSYIAMVRAGLVGFCSHPIAVSKDDHDDSALQSAAVRLKEFTPSILELGQDWKQKHNGTDTADLEGEVRNAAYSLQRERADCPSS